jgi:hypothetical protein
MTDVAKVSAQIKLQLISDVKEKIEADKQQILQLKSVLEATNTGAAAKEATTDQLNKATQSLAAHNEELKKYKSLATEATESGSGFETMLNRMAARLLVLYAVRGALKFTEDTIANVEALERLNETSGISLQTLQVLQANGNAVGMTFQQVGNAVSFFTKQLGEAKNSTVEVINGMGLSFERLIAQKPDERFREVAMAVNDIVDPLEKARVSMALFGTEGIEAVIQRFTSLKDSSAGVAASVIGDWEYIINFWRSNIPDITGSFEEVVSVFLRLSTASAQLVTGGGSSGIADWFNHIKDAAILSAGQGITGFIAALIELDKVKEGMHKEDTVLLSDAQVYDKVTGELVAKTHALTEAQQAELDNWSQLGIATLDAALKIGVTREQWEAYRKTMMMAFDDQKSQFTAAKVHYQGQITDIEMLSAAEQKNFGTTKEGLELKISELQQIEVLESQALSGILKRAQQLTLEAENITDVGKRTKALQDIEVEEARLIEDFHKRLRPLMQQRMDDENQLSAIVTKESLAEEAAAQANLARFGVTKTSEGTIPLDQANDPVFKAQQDLEFAKSQYAANKIGIDALTAAENKFADSLMTVATNQDKVNAALGKPPTLIDSTAKALDKVTDSAGKASQMVGTFVGSYGQWVTGLMGEKIGMLAPGSQIGMPQIIPTHAAGGPTREGPAMLHDGEFVVPQGGALVKSGGGSVVVNMEVHGTVISEGELKSKIQKAVVEAASGSRKFSSSS